MYIRKQVQKRGYWRHKFRYWHLFDCVALTNVCRI